MWCLWSLVAVTFLMCSAVQCTRKFSNNSLTSNAGCGKSRTQPNSTHPQFRSRQLKAVKRQESTELDSSSFPLTSGGSAQWLCTPRRSSGSVDTRLCGAMKKPPAWHLNVRQARQRARTLVKGDGPRLTKLDHKAAAPVERHRELPSASPLDDVKMREVRGPVP